MWWWIDNARTLFQWYYSDYPLERLVFKHDSLSVVLIWWVWCITYLTWPMHDNYCSTTTRPHVTTCTRPSNFLMWNIKSWVSPGDEANLCVHVHTGNTQTRYECDNYITMQVDDHGTELHRGVKIIEVETDLSTSENQWDISCRLNQTKSTCIHTCQPGRHTKRDKTCQKSVISNQKSWKPWIMLILL